MLIKKRTITVLLILVFMLSNITISTGYSQTSAEKLNQLGLLLNISEDDLAAELTREVGLTMILKALGYTQEEANEYEDDSPFIDTERWSKGWISLAYSLNITTGTSEKTFAPTDSLTERQYITFLLRALGHDPSKSFNNTESLAKENGILGLNDSINNGKYTKFEAAKAMYNSLTAKYITEGIPLVNLLMDKGLFSLNDAVSVGLKEGNLEILRVRVLSAHEFQVVFNQSVDTNKITFLLDDSLNTYAVLATWNSGKNTANIVTADDMINGKYMIRANYLSTNSLTYEQEFLIKSNSKTELTIVNNAVVLKDDAELRVQINDGFGIPTNDQNKNVTVVNKNLNTNVTVNELRDNVYRLTNLLSMGSRKGDTLEVTLEANGKSITKEISIVESAELSDFTMINPLVNNNRLTSNSYNLPIDYISLTDEGTISSLPLHVSNSDGRNNYETIGDITFTSSNPGLINVDEMKVDAQGRLLFNIENTFGTSVLSARNNVSGLTTSITVSVYSDAQLSKVVVEPITKVIALGEKAELSAVGYDQFGAKMDFNYISGLVYQSSNEEVVPLTNIKLMNNKLTYTGDEEGASLITIYSKESRLLLSLYVAIEGESEPIGIIDVTMPVYFEASTDATYDLTYNDIYVIDQFERGYDLDIHDEVVVISHEDETIDNINFGMGRFSSGRLIVSANGEVGTGSYDFTLEDIGYTTYVVSFTTIATEDINNYILDDVEDIEIGLSNKEIIELRGLTDDGDEVILASDTIDLVTISDPKIATIERSGNSIEVVGLEGGTAVIKAWRDGKVIATSQVTVLPNEEE